MTIYESQLHEKFEIVFIAELVLLGLRKKLITGLVKTLKIVEYNAFVNFILNNLN